MSGRDKSGTGMGTETGIFRVKAGRAPGQEIYNVATPLINHYV